MCLAIPGKVSSINRSTNPLTGIVSFGGVQKQVCLEFVPDICVDEYVIVHVGFAIGKMNERQALETLALFHDMDDALQEIKNTV